MLESIYATAPIGLAVLSCEGRYLRVNQWLADINGASVEAHLGRSVEEMVPAIAPQVRKVIQTVCETGKGVYDVRVVGQTNAAPGDARIWREQWSPILEPDGTVRAINVVVEDITERENADAHARESASFTRRVLDNLFTFVGVLDLDGVLREANRAPMEMAGLQPADVIGKPFWDCHWWSYSAAEQERLKAGFQRAAAGEVVRYDVQVRARGSDLLWIDFQLAPLRDEQGRITHVIPSGNDIVARVEAENALKLRHAELESLLVSAPIGLAFFDRQYRYLRVNQELAEINGLPVEEHLGRPIPEVLPHAPPVLQLIDQVFETGQSIGNIEVEGETHRDPGVRRVWLTGFFPVEHQAAAWRPWASGWWRSRTASGPKRRSPS